MTLSKVKVYAVRCNDSGRLGKHFQLKESAMAACDDTNRSPGGRMSAYVSVAETTAIYDGKYYYTKAQVSPPSAADLARVEEAKAAALLRDRLVAAGFDPDDVLKCLTTHTE